MTVWRLIGIIFIFFCTTIAWAILGTSILARTNSGYTELNRQVEGLWGSEHYQKAPTITLKTIQKDGDKEKEVITPVELESSNIQVGLQLQHRRKGLLWYATYDVDFDASYSFKNPLDQRAEATVIFFFPASASIYDAFEFRVNDVPITPNESTGYEGVHAVLKVPPGGEVPIHVAYKSRGLDRWSYSFSDGITTVKNFSLKAVTDFSDYDFLGGLEWKTDQPMEFVFAPDGTKVSSASSGPVVPIWQISDGALLRDLDGGHTGNIVCAAYSPDSKILAAGAPNKTIELWDTSDGSFLGKLSGHSDEITSVVFSADGTLVASGSKDGKVLIWRVSDGSLLSTLERSKEEASGSVNSLAFTPDGTILASASEDFGTIYIWSVSDGTILKALGGHTSGIESLAFSPDGRMLASASKDGTVRLWGLKP